jgi:hypothetical protein
MSHQIALTTVNHSGMELVGYSIGLENNLLYQPNNSPDGSIVKYDCDTVEVGGGELIPVVYYDRDEISGCHIGTCNGYELLFQPNNGPDGSVVALNEHHTYVGGLEVIRQAINDNFDSDSDDGDDEYSEDSAT